MRKFLERAMDKVSRMNEESIRGLLRILSDENERLEAVLDSMLDGIAVCDEDHIPILVNKAAERFLPLSYTNLFDQALWDSVRDEELSVFFDTALNGDESILDREFALDTKLGARVLSFSITPLVRDQRIKGTLIHIQDTTDKRKKEARLRRAESLASLTTLAAGVAHEIKNPLGSISIHVQLLEKAMKEKPDKKMERYLSIVSEEIDRLNKIVVDFLFAVRPMDIKPINDDINALVLELAEFMKPEAKNASIELEAKLEASANSVPFDRRYIKQVLLNLIKNSMSAMPKGGKLLLKTSSNQDEFIIRVEDSGSGIDNDKIGKIFEPYYTTKENGTGLGLTLSYKIIKEHGGDISVSSKPGAGSVFTISLPIPQKEKRLLPAETGDFPLMGSTA
ncbi:ATP-binding protein [Spirochaetota bacterium]